MDRKALCEFGAFLERYVSDLPRYSLRLVVKKEYFPYIMDLDKSATKVVSVGTTMGLLTVVVRALISVVGDTRMLFGHRNRANFHGLCPDIIVNSRTAVRIREKQLALLTLEHSEVDWGDIVDERVLTSNGLRVLGSSQVQGHHRREGDDQEVQRGGGGRLRRPSPVSYTRSKQCSLPSCRRASPS